MMLREDLRHGFSEAEWNAGKKEARSAMIACAKRRAMITYSELVQEISSVPLSPQDVRLAHMLGEISSEEDAEGRGMLTVVVVHKHGDMEPGKGFFELAKHLGRDTKDQTACWARELKKIYAVWSLGDE